MKIGKKSKMQGIKKHKIKIIIKIQKIKMKIRKEKKLKKRVIKK